MTLNNDMGGDADEAVDVDPSQGSDPSQATAQKASALLAEATPGPVPAVDLALADHSRLLNQAQLPVREAAMYANPFSAHGQAAEDASNPFLAGAPGMVAAGAAPNPAPNPTLACGAEASGAHQPAAAVPAAAAAGGVTKSLSQAAAAGMSPKTLNQACAAAAREAADAPGAAKARGRHVALGGQRRGAFPQPAAPSRMRPQPLAAVGASRFQGFDA